MGSLSVVQRKTLVLIIFITFSEKSYGSVVRGNPASQILVNRQDNDESPIFDESPLRFYKNDLVMEKDGMGTNLVRMERSMKEDVEAGFKEFSEKIAKLPDQLTGSIKKYFEEKGVSMEGIQKILTDIWNGVEKLIGEIKKAL